jgi:hypothetical protein
MKIVYSIATGLLFAVTMFVYLSITSKKDIAIVVSIFVFIITPFIAYFKIFSKIDFGGKFLKIDKERIIYSGLSNFFLHKLPVGGRLYLLDDKLIFQTNLINFMKRHQEIIFLNEILNVGLDDSMRNRIFIKTNNSEVKKFVVYKKELWKQKVENQITKKNKHER